MSKTENNTANSSANSNAHSQVKPIKRRRGRPPASESAEHDIREQIIVSAKEVYADNGYNGSSVERIIARANISRPTFYRIFKDRYEVIDIVVRQANEELFAAVQEAIATSESDGVVGMAKASVDAYFAWCEQRGAFVGVMYAEMHDSNSPASAHRKNNIEAFVALVHAKAQQAGRPKLNPMLYDVLVRAVEHTGSAAFSPDPKPDDVIEGYRNVAKRILIASLASPAEYEDIPSLEKLADE